MAENPITYDDFLKRYSFNKNKDLLGQGSFGEVVKAYDNYYDEHVALKIAEVKPEYENFSLKNEVNLAINLPVHPNIARYDICHRFSDKFKEYDIAVMQYYKEGNLKKLIDNREITPGQKFFIINGILEGLFHLHKHRIVHRDIKPENILLVFREHDRIYVPKIADFGISKMSLPDEGSRIFNSLTGGTPFFSAPEQLKGEEKIRYNVDLWSFGVMLYLLLTGELPFNVKNWQNPPESERIKVIAQIISGISKEKLKVIEQDPYRTIINKCLVTDPEKRAQSAEELLRTLNPFEAEMMRQHTEESRTSAEDKLWKNTSANGKIEDYENYLQQFPDGKYSKLAQDVILRMREEAEAAVWQQACDGDTVKDFEKYLKVYPDGKYSDEAKDRINRLKSQHLRTYKETFRRFYSENEKITQGEREILRDQEKSLKLTKEEVKQLEDEIIREITLAKDEEAWKEACELKDLDSYYDYLKKFPEGRHVKEAESLLSSLNEIKHNEKELEAKINIEKDTESEPVADIKNKPDGTIILNAEEEEKAWEKTITENSKEAYQRYLKKYPGGIHAEAAKMQVEKINQTILEDENIAWEEATADNLIKSYRSFLKHFPSGSFSSLATEKMGIRLKERRRKWFIAFSSLVVYTLFSIVIIGFIIFLIAYLVPGESDAWNDAKTLDTKSSYESYLSEYPDGSHANLARVAFDYIVIRENEENYKALIFTAESYLREATSDESKYKLAADKFKEASTLNPAAKYRYDEVIGIISRKVTAYKSGIITLERIKDDPCDPAFIEYYRKILNLNEDTGIRIRLNNCGGGGMLNPEEIFK
jgi:serine/threonine protein kinase